MSTATPTRATRLTAVMRDGGRVTALELFFDLVFVLALTQCTTLMARTTTWLGVARAMLVLGVLWWAWVGYAWLTSVVDPEEGSVRMAMFAAMAALLVAALCVPRAFESLALLFACAYAAVRGAHIALFMLASRDDPALRHSVRGLAFGTALGVGLLVAAALASGALRGTLWVVALVLDMAGPFFFGAEGWRLVPEHFAERHGDVLIIALGEAIVAIGVGASVAHVDAGVVVGAVLGMAVAACLWWLYFDVVALVALRRLTNAHEGRERNEIARDSFSYLHLPMVAGIALIALGMRKVLAHVGAPLHTVAACALFGGAAVYLLAHVAFRLRNIRTLNRQRLVCAVLLLALLPVAVTVSSLGALAILAGVLVALIFYEVRRFGAVRERLRQRLLHEAVD